MFRILHEIVAMGNVPAMNPAVIVWKFHFKTDAKPITKWGRAFYAKFLTNNAFHSSGPIRTHEVRPRISAIGKVLSGNISLISEKSRPWHRERGIHFLRPKRTDISVELPFKGIRYTTNGRQLRTTKGPRHGLNNLLLTWR